MTMPSKRGNSEGSIYQRKGDGRWVAAISVTDPTGRVRIVRRYRRTRGAARDALKELQKQQDAGVRFAKQVTIEKFLADWLEGAVKASLRPKTYAGYQSIVAQRINPRVGKLRLDRLTAARIQRLYAELAESGLAPRTVVNTHRVLRKALDQAVKWGDLPWNPCDRIEPPRAPRAEMKTLTRDQVDAFMVANAGDRLSGLYTLAFTTGMRLGELLGLKWPDVDFDGSRLRVVRTLQAVPGQGLMFGEPKTARSRRTIMLSQRAVAALREHRRRQLEERLAFPGDWVDPELVFCNLFGAPLSPGNVSNQFKAALKRAELPKVRFHDTRHTAASLLLEAGTHPKIVSELLGHASVAFTLDVYSHVVPTMHGEAAAAMDRLFGS